MQEPPKQVNIAVELLQSLRRQEDSLARIRQLLTTIQLVLIGMLVFGVLVFMSEVVLKH